MTHATDADDATQDEPPIESLSAPDTLRERDDVPVRQNVQEHEDSEHCSTDIAGRAAVGVTNDDGETLLLCNDELEIALLPHGSVEPGDDWIAATRREVEAQTGVAIAIEDVLLLRDIDHVVGGEDEIHASTHGIVFAGRPTGGEIQDCKRSADAGSDPWYAGWFDGLPEGIERPEGGPGEDLGIVLD